MAGEPIDTLLIEAIRDCIIKKNCTPKNIYLGQHEWYLLHEWAASRIPGYKILEGEEVPEFNGYKCYMVHTRNHFNVT